VVGAAAVLALLAVFAVAVQLGGAVVTRHRAEAAGDLAALAAAAWATSGAERACVAARRVTDRMAVRLVSCELRGWQAAVQVEARPPGALARFGAARASARAGPVGATSQIRGAPTTNGR
jgi:secretion/DNA translocation related TadE-like protein